MDEYKEIVEWYKSTLIFKFSQIGFALNCDLLFSDRLPLLPANKCFELIKYLKDGYKIFIAFDIFINNIQNFYIIINNIKLLKIKVIFYIQYEPYLPSEIINLLLPISYCIYAQNNNYSHPDVHCMPIGIRDCGITLKPMHDNFYHSYLFNEGLKTVNKEHLCIVGGIGNLHLLERIKCYNYVKDLPFVYDISKFNYTINITSYYGKIPVHKFYDFINRSHYVVAPSGGGVDTHRFFEAIYLKTIPIVKKTNTAFDKVYNIFPCLVINDWNDITLDLLKSNLPILKTKMNNFHKKYPNCFMDTSILNELLLKT